MFGTPESATLIHQGSLALPLLAIAALVVGAYAASPGFAIGLTAVNALVVLLLYVPALSPPPGSSYSVLAGVLAAVGLAGFCWVAVREDPAPGQALIAAEG
jgi:apolipoprotein N-acyltransferase